MAFGITTSSGKFDLLGTIERFLGKGAREEIEGIGSEYRARLDGIEESLKRIEENQSLILGCLRRENIERFRAAEVPELAEILEES